MRDYNRSEVEDKMIDLVIRGKAYAVFEVSIIKSS
jgi:hypothetical protein